MQAPFRERYGASARDDGIAESPAALETLRRRSADLLQRAEPSGQAPLRDLRDLYLTAQAAEIAWVILAQAARAARDGELLTAVGTCHEEAELRGKWLRTRIKERAPQVLATGPDPRAG